jgi:hypothetical protein
VGSAPRDLAYRTNPATYTKGVQIAPNAPACGGGAVTQYSVSPALPTGLQIAGDTGTISGTPTAVNPASSYVVRASNGFGSASASLTIAVHDEAPRQLVYASNPAIYVKGTPISANAPTVWGGAATSYSVSPALPPGLSMDTVTGVLSGTPTAVAGPTPYAVTAQNSGGNTSAVLTLSVVDACVQAAACSSTNPCDLTASIECGSGAPVCTDRTFKAAGSSCGTNLVCSPGGSCIACTAGAVCASSNPCHTASITCGSGAPVCTDTGTQPDNTACGNLTCKAGVCGGGVTMPPGLLAHVEFPGTAADTSGNGYTPTVAGTASYVADRHGIASNALRFDGATTTVTLPVNAAFSLTSFTLYAIFTVEDLSAHGILVSKGTATGYGNYTMDILPSSSGGRGGYVHDVSNGNWSAPATSAALPTSTYKHLAVTVSGSNFYSFLDGALEVTATAVPAPVQNSQAVVIGAHPGFHFFHKGVIDQVLVFNRALSGQEIANLYQLLR